MHETRWPQFVQRIRKMIWVVGISLTILVNIGGAKRPMYKGAQHQVGTDLVSVFAYRGKPYETPIPVMKWDRANENDTNGKFVETDQQVDVYLRNGYKDDLIVWYPRMTLGILATTIFLHFGISAALTCKSPKASTP